MAFNTRNNGCSCIVIDLQRKQIWIARLARCHGSAVEASVTQIVPSIESSLTTWRQFKYRFLIPRNIRIDSTVNRSIFCLHRYVRYRASNHNFTKCKFESPRLK